MPSRKQRKRAQKERRHEYETVWVDSEGNELDEAPDDYVAPAPREKRADGKKPQSKPKRPQRAPNPRTPQPPSWRRAIRRGAIIGGVLILFLFMTSKATTGGRVAAALVYGVPYMGLFIAFTYYLDRFAYRRWQRRTGAPPTKR